MQTHQIHVSEGHDRAEEIRHELFAFPEVLEVFATGRPNALLVVCTGHPCPARWLRALRAAGYEVPALRGSRAIRRVGAHRLTRGAVGFESIERFGFEEGCRESVELLTMRHQ